MKNRVLYLIPARGGSKGIPGKNIKPLLGKPLIHYAIESARELANDVDICVSTDDVTVANCAKEVGLKIPFMRPASLATDTATSNDVILHAIHFYKDQGIEYDVVVLLQPTSPFRQKQYIRDAIDALDSETEMVVSVKISQSNPYINLVEEDDNGHLKICKGDGKITRRQDAPDVYEYNGSIYAINIASLLKTQNIKHFTKVRKLVMPSTLSIDIDTHEDWVLAERIGRQEFNINARKNDGSSSMI